MASALTDRLSRLVKTMRGQARITEDNVQEMLREVRMALLEADALTGTDRECRGCGAVVDASRTDRATTRSDGAKAPLMLDLADG